MRSNTIDRTGEKHITNEGYPVEIIKYVNNINCDILFEDGTVLQNVVYRQVKLGQIKNPNHKSVLNIGYIGIGFHKIKSEGKHTKLYRTWKNMLKRGCYAQYKNEIPSYKNVTIYEKWKCFQNFGNWFENNFNPEYMQGWELDKDILIKGNKIYSPETCCFVPAEINKLFVKNDTNRGKYPIGVCINRKGTFTSSVRKKDEVLWLGTFDTEEEAFEVYKIAKESYIKEVADIWKDQIEPRVYQAMYNYKVEITD